MPLSLAQQALWFLDQLAPGEPTFNVASAVRIAGPLDVEVLGRSFDEMIRRHEALRTTFAVRDGRPVQIIDAESVAADERDGPERLARRFAARPRPNAWRWRNRVVHSTWAAGPLARVRVLVLGPQDHVLLLTMHHIITDGWSFWVASRELAVLYEAFRQGLPSPLPEPPVQYADYAIWQRNWLQGDVLEDLLGYWSGQLEGAEPLELPTDRPRPALRTSRGAWHAFALPPGSRSPWSALPPRGGHAVHVAAGGVPDAPASV